MRKSFQHALQSPQIQASRQLMTIVNALGIATSRINARYFLLCVAGLEHPIKRERVYCYELYHQLRLILGDNELVLTGEPDKRSNPAFENERQPNPDLILHMPGSHRSNSSVVEVECRPSLLHLRKDLRTLKQMRNKGYQELVLLLFAVNAVPWPDLAQAAKDTGVNLSDIVVLLHKAANQQATIENAPSEYAA